MGASWEGCWDINIYIFFIKLIIIMINPYFILIRAPFLLFVATTKRYIQTLISSRNHTARFIPPTIILDCLKPLQFQPARWGLDIGHLAIVSSDSLTPNSYTYNKNFIQQQSQFFVKIDSENLCLVYRNMNYFPVSKWGNLNKTYSRLTSLRALLTSCVIACSIGRLYP